MSLDESPVTLLETLLYHLNVPKESKLWLNIMNTSNALLSDNNNNIADNNDNISVIRAVDLISSVSEKSNAAIREFAAVWIAVKFWCASLQRVSLASLVSDIICPSDSTNEIDDTYHEDFLDSFEIVDQICKAEMVLLRQQRYIIPGVSLCEIHS